MQKTKKDFIKYTEKGEMICLKNHLVIYQDEL